MEIKHLYSKKKRKISVSRQRIRRCVTYKNNDVTKTSIHGDKTPVLKEEEEDFSKIKQIKK